MQGQDSWILCIVGTLSEFGDWICNTTQWCVRKPGNVCFVYLFYHGRSPWRITVFGNMIVIFVQPSSCRKSQKKTALLLQPYLPKPNMAPENRPSQKENSWKAKCPIFKAIVAGFRGKVASKNRTLGVPGYYFHSEFLCFFRFCLIHYLELDLSWDSYRRWRFVKAHGYVFVHIRRSRTVTSWFTSRKYTYLESKLLFISINLTNPKNQATVAYQKCCEKCVPGVVFFPISRHSMCLDGGFWWCVFLSVHPKKIGKVFTDFWWICFNWVVQPPTRWALTSYKRSYNPCKWPKIHG